MEIINNSRRSINAMIVFRLRVFPLSIGTITGNNIRLAITSVLYDREPQIRTNLDNIRIFTYDGTSHITVQRGGIVQGEKSFQNLTSTDMDIMIGERIQIPPDTSVIYPDGHFTVEIENDPANKIYSLLPGDVVEYKDLIGSRLVRVGMVIMPYRYQLKPIQRHEIR